MSSKIIPFSINNSIVNLPEGYARISDDIENFTVKQTDIWVLGFPKSGTTWLQEMVWCLANNLNLSCQRSMLEKFPVLESKMHHHHSDEYYILESIKYCDDLPDPRFIKCHLPWNALPKQLRTGEAKPKIIYIHRDPKDVVVSMQNFLNNMGFSNQSIEQLSESMLENRIMRGPYWNHVNSAFENQKILPNLLLISYEDMLNDLSSIIRKTAKHLEVDIDENQIENLKHHLSFQSMKKNKTIAVREIKGEIKTVLAKGVAGRHKENMSPELISRFEKWENENRKY
ncbi:luciferin sulfotransferase-like [Chrysoperla carnea]|uniref:luciferin sulfotransferase-like n=1 Tax=Chrysoperla carnea TaxID=189513 RepID=UPI001D07BCB8|nr:luciferin sulfotransferase-like [Chrysoperla carnea]